MQASGLFAREGRQAAKDIAGFWWLFLLLGIVWIAVSAVILQFDQASVTTVGVIIGIMFFASGVQQLTIAGLVEDWSWLYIVFGVLFLGAAVITFISPENTFAALADILGFLFALVGVFWIIEAFAVREVSDLWWIGLLSGILMVILGFYTAGQFFVEKAFVLLVFAGIWALMHGITDIIRAFQLRKLGKLV